MMNLLEKLTSSSKTTTTTISKTDDIKEDESMRDALERAKSLAAEKAKTMSTSTRPKLNLKKKTIKNEAISGGIAWMKYAKGPDGSIGFKRRRSKKRRSNGTEEKKAKIVVTDEDVQFLRKFSNSFFGKKRRRNKSKKEAIEFVASVKRIDMRNHVLTKEDLSSLSRILPLCKQLENLNLYGQNLGSDLWDLLVVLCQCHKLESLNLSANYIGDTGAFLLGEVLRRCRSLKRIGLCWNHVCDEGMMALMNQVMAKDDFELLDTRYNGVSETLRKQIDVAIENWVASRGQSTGVVKRVLL